MTTYTTILNKTTGKTQTQWSSESHEELKKQIYNHLKFLPAFTAAFLKTLTAALIGFPVMGQSVKPISPGPGWKYVNSTENGYVWWWIKVRPKRYTGRVSFDLLSTTEVWDPTSEYHYLYNKPWTNTVRCQTGEVFRKGTGWEPITPGSSFEEAAAIACHEPERRNNNAI